MNIEPDSITWKVVSREITERIKVLCKELTDEDAVYQHTQEKDAARRTELTALRDLMTKLTTGETNVRD